MTVQRPLLVVCLVAAVNGLFFMAYQRPDWTTQWTDQDGYRRLAEVLASTGTFTRYPDSPQFVPEVIRTPLYPAFVAVIYMRHGSHQYNGMSRRDWKIFFTSLAIGNIYWTLTCYMGISLVEWVWRAVKTGAC